MSRFVKATLPLACCWLWLLAAAPARTAQQTASRGSATASRRANIWPAPAIASPATPRRKASCSPAGAPMPTPFGTLYTSNITPDRETGIGTWTADQFYQMMHTGRFPDGGLLYPAMPFGSYTKVTREDSDAIFAYLRSIPPVRQANRPHELTFPLQQPLADPRLAHAVLHRRRIQARPEAIGRMEPRRLSGRGARPLRHVPYARSMRSAAARNRRPSRAA